MKRSRRAFAAGAGLLCALVLAEFGAYAHYSARPRVQRRFVLSKLLHPEMIPTSPRLAGQRYLGVLSPYDVLGWRDFLIPDSILAWRPAKNVALYYEMPDYDDEDLIIANGQGFYSIGEASFDYAPAKPAGTFRVVVLGGSSVMGQGAPNPSQNLPAQIKRVLEPYFKGRRLEVINAGVDGYTSGQELLYLQSDLLRYRPDLVISYDGGVDAYEDQWCAAVFDGEGLPLKMRTHQFIDDRLNQSSYLTGDLTILAQTAGTYLSAAGNDAVESFAVARLAAGLGRAAERRLGWGGAAGDLPPFPYDARGVTAYRQNHEQMIALARHFHFKTAWFLAPGMKVGEKRLTSREAAFLVPGDPLHERMFYRDARAAMAEARKASGPDKGVCIADLSSSFAGVADDVYADAGHLLAKGNEIVAREIAARLAGCGFLPDRRP